MVHWTGFAGRASIAHRFSERLSIRESAGTGAFSAGLFVNQLRGKLFSLGYEDDAEAFVSWLLHTTRLTRPRLNTLYDVYGNEIAHEKILRQLSGYKNSSPVHIGNAASEQRQLDVYGEVIEAVSHFFCRKGRIDREAQKMLCQYGDYVCRHWREPDNGMWEPRTPPQHYTHSRSSCWLALDRLIGLQKRGLIDRLPVEKFAQAALLEPKNAKLYAGRRRGDA